MGIQTISAVLMATPTHFLLLTRKPLKRAPQRAPTAGEVAKFRDQVRRFNYEVRLRVKNWQAAWVFELSGETNLHCHMVARASELLKPDVKAAASAAGLGLVNVDPIYSVRSVANYILKEATMGIDEPFAVASARMALYKLLGGGRVIHSTRGFWRDHLRRPIRGGVREARAVAMRAVAMRDIVQGIFGSAFQDEIQSLEVLDDLGEAGSGPD